VLAHGEARAQPSSSRRGDAASGSARPSSKNTTNRPHQLIVVAQEAPQQGAARPHVENHQEATDDGFDNDECTSMFTGAMPYITPCAKPIRRGLAV
jgi:hypothetical protein